MMRQTEQQWKELQQKVKVPDPVLENQEAERKRKLELDIKLAVGTIEDRQAGERWMDPKPPQTQKKKSGIMAKIGSWIWSAILAWWHSPRKQGGAFDSGNYTQERRPQTRRKRSVNGKATPIRLKKKAWQDPDYEDGPNFDDSAFNRQFGGSPFGKGPRF
jgi:hypothetical protein